MPALPGNPEGPLAKTHTFGNFHLDLAAGEVRKRGVKLRLSGQPFEILRLLLERPGQLVSREELRGRLWANETFVDFDHGLNAAINKLREILGDSSERPRFIETLPRRGYRFIAQVHDGPGALLPLSDRPARKRVRSLAVLPLENLSGDPGQEYFADGMTDALITDLAKISALRVISRTSVMQYKGARKSLAQIAQELNVDAVLEGSVLRVGERVRISAQLVHSGSDAHLWAERYERDLHDVLAIQADVAQAIAAEIRVRVTPRERKDLRLVRKVDPKSYEAYLLGRYHWNRRAPDALKKSLEYFQQAIEREPRYALAYAGLADAYAMLGSFFAVIPALEAMPKAQAAAEKALEINESLGEAHTTLAFIKAVHHYDWEAAESGFRRALKLNPGYATCHHWYGVCLRFQGKLDHAQTEIERALELDPLSLQINNELAAVFCFQGAYDKAIEQARKTLDLDPSFFNARVTLALAYEHKGMLVEALAEAEQLPIPWARLGFTGACYASLGRVRDAKRAIDELQELAKHQNVPGFAIAWIYAHLRDKEATLKYLEQTYAQRFTYLVVIKLESAFDFLRADPRFQDLQRRIGLPS
jgi:TolB-like protein/Tfp pilus assembly protein PilF